MTPSTGITSPACTNSASPTTTSSIATSFNDVPRRRWAMRGARSVSDLRSRSARATAKSSRRLPPAYMTATTAPARNSPSRSAPDIDTKATASTPMRPAMRSRTMDTNSPMTTGTVPAAQTHRAAVVKPAAKSSAPTVNPVSAIATSDLRCSRSDKTNGISALTNHRQMSLIGHHKNMRRAPRS